MPRLGDAAVRPREDSVIVTAIAEMTQEATILSTNAAVAWLNGARTDVPIEEVRKAFAVTFGALPNDISVVHHYPQAVLRPLHPPPPLHRRRQPPGFSFRKLPCPGTSVAPRGECRERRHASPHAAAARERAHVLLERLRRVQDHRGRGKIPKIKWFTLPARGQPARGRRGLRHQVLIHLTIHEDFSDTRQDADGLLPRPKVHPFDVELGVVDGEGTTTGTRGTAATTAMTGMAGETTMTTTEAAAGGTTAVATATEAGVHG